MTPQAVPPAPTKPVADASRPWRTVAVVTGLELATDGTLSGCGRIVAPASRLQEREVKDDQGSGDLRHSCDVA
jgi:hypothetical protein